MSKIKTESLGLSDEDATTWALYIAFEAMRALRIGNRDGSPRTTRDRIGGAVAEVIEEMSDENVEHFVDHYLRLYNARKPQDEGIHDYWLTH